MPQSVAAAPQTLPLLRTHGRRGAATLQFQTVLVWAGRLANAEQTNHRQIHLQRQMIFCRFPGNADAASTQSLHHHPRPFSSLLFPRPTPAASLLLSLANDHSTSLTHYLLVTTSFSSLLPICPLRLSSTSTPYPALSTSSSILTILPTSSPPPVSTHRSPKSFFRLNATAICASMTPRVDKMSNVATRSGKFQVFAG